MRSRGEKRAIMARMKKLIPLVLLLLPLLVPLPVKRASADELRYAVAADSNVWFYAAESEDEKLFLLPESYYVRVLSVGEEFTAAEYLVNDPPFRKVMGYCRTDALTFVDFIPARPYLRKEITVSYTLPGGGSGVDELFSSIERTFVYYGDRYEKGQLYFYVLYDGKFGYIPAEEEVVFERNDDYLSVPAGPGVSAEEEPPKESSKGASLGVQIAACCIVLVAAVAIGVFVLRGKRASPSDEREP